MNGKKIKIGIITFHCAENYGAYLQSYAMQLWINRNYSDKLECDIIDYRPKYLIEPYKIKILERVMNQKNMISKFKVFIISMIEVPYKIAKKLKFYKAILKLKKTKKIYQTSNFIIEDDYSLVILGSDQIWNPKQTNGFDRVYFGENFNQNCKKISYAASLGVMEYNDDEKKQLTYLLNKLDAIGVRERHSINLLKNLTTKEIEVNLDPTLLLEREMWMENIKNINEKNYILIYQLQKNESILFDAYHIAKSQNKEILHFGDPSIKPIFTDVNVKSISFSGPFEFLSYIKHADLVLTNSFHATCFSIIFNKEFYSYLQNNRSERIISLAEIGDFKDRLVKYGEKLTNKISINQSTSNVSLIYDRFSNLRKKSSKYLSNYLDTL